MDGALVLLFCPKPCCNYHLVVSCPQQCHIGINVDYWCHYNRNTHNVAFCIFSCRTLNNWYKLLVIIATWNEKQGKAKLCQNVTIFLPKTLPSFSNAGKTVNVPEFEFDKFWKTIFWRSRKCNIYIVTTSALDFKQLYIFYIFFPIKWIYLSERIPYLAQTFNCSSQKQLHISKSVCVVSLETNA